MTDIDWIRPGTASVLVDGAFGSTGKGLISAWLAKNADRKATLSTTNAGAQAGHTTRFKDKPARDFICYHLPTTAVVQYGPAYINAGSIIDVDRLMAEIASVKVGADMVSIHPRAALITEEDKLAELHPDSANSRLASTQKGVGSALSRKIMRTAVLAGNDPKLKAMKMINRIDLNRHLAEGDSVVVEVPQGFGLSLNHGYSYPYCTSRDCWVGSAISDAGIHPSFVGNVCMVVRTKPIRVGATYNEQGEKLGDSGPFYSDSQELDWNVDLPWVTPERTTVTQRIRRIASWSNKMYLDALMLNRPSLVALTFCDYLNDGEEFAEHVRAMRSIERVAGLFPAHIYSTGPFIEDVSREFDQVFQFLTRRGKMR